MIRKFDSYADLQSALALPVGEPGAFRFLPEYAPAHFKCADCGHGELRTGGGTGYAVVDNAMLCYACCDNRQRAELKTHAGPFYGYLSSDCARVTTWSGGALMTITHADYSDNGWHGSRIYSVRARDCHGNMWHGRGAGPSMVITMRRMKAKP